MESATFVDGIGDDWHPRVTFGALRRAEIELGESVTMPKERNFLVRLQTIYVCMYHACKEEIGERGMTREQFEARLDSADMAKLVKIMEAWGAMLTPPGEGGKGDDQSRP